MEKPERIDFKYNLKVYIGLLKRYKLLFATVLVSVLIIESSYLADRFLFKTIVDKGTLWAAGELPKDQFLTAVSVIALIFAIVIAVRTIGKWLDLHMVNKLESGLIYDLKTKYFDHIILLSHGFHTSHKTGSLISRLVRGGKAVERMTDIIIFNTAPLVFQLIIVSTSLVFFDAETAVILFVTIVAFIIFSIMLQRMQEESSVKANDADDSEKANIADMFTNIDSIKYYGKEEYVKKRYRDISNVTRQWTVTNWNYWRWVDAGQSLILSIGAVLLIFIPLNKFLNYQITLGTLVFIYTAYVTLTGPLFGFIHGLREYYRTMADFESLFQYGKIDNDIKDSPDASTLRIKEGTIDFNNIDFSYGKRKIFEKFSLKIPKNRKIALVGHSGSGKSTLVKLLYRFYDVEKGRILIDNRNIKYFKQESLRSEMSIVPQECVLFDDTIYNNIAFSRPDATAKEVHAAIRFSQLDRIIKDFPDKEKTIVGERGVKLSGGEKQRVSIARAILADKKVLMLDEATSSLDSELEHEIQKDLARLMKGRTTIIIAHRLSTIMSADTIIVLKKGRIVQQGNHRQLIKKKGEYRKLWNLQRGGYIR